MFMVSVAKDERGDILDTFVIEGFSIEGIDEVETIDNEVMRELGIVVRS